MEAQGKMYLLWQHYYDNTQGLIYVVDSSDRTFIEESRERLHMILQHELMRDVPVLVFANKMDLSRAMTVTEVSEQLGVMNLRNKCHVQASNAQLGIGLWEGMEWMARNVINK